MRWYGSSTRNLIRLEGKRPKIELGNTSSIDTRNGRVGGSDERDAVDDEQHVGKQRIRDVPYRSVTFCRSRSPENGRLSKSTQRDRTTSPRSGSSLTQLNLRRRQASFDPRSGSNVVTRHVSPDVDGRSS